MVGCGEAEQEAAPMAQAHAEELLTYEDSEEAKAAAEKARKSEEAESSMTSPFSGPGVGGSMPPGAKSLLVTQGDDPMLVVVSKGGTYTANATTGEFISRLKNAPGRGNLKAP